MPKDKEENQVEEVEKLTCTEQEVEEIKES